MPEEGKTSSRRQIGPNRSVNKSPRLRDDLVHSCVAERGVSLCMSSVCRGLMECLTASSCRRSSRDLSTKRTSSASFCDPSPDKCRTTSERLGHLRVRCRTFKMWVVFYSWTPPTTSLTLLGNFVLCASSTSIDVRAVQGLVTIMPRNGLLPCGPNDTSREDYTNRTGALVCQVDFQREQRRMSRSPVLGHMEWLSRSPHHNE